MLKTITNTIDNSQRRAIEAPISNRHRHITGEQKSVYRDACAVIKQLGTNRKFDDGYICLTADATYENVVVKLPRLDYLTAARFCATGGMVERYRPGMWIGRLHNLAVEASKLAAQQTVNNAMLDSLRFEPIDDEADDYRLEKELAEAS